MLAVHEAGKVRAFIFRCHPFEPSILRVKTARRSELAEALACS